MGVLDDPASKANVDWTKGGKNSVLQFLKEAERPFGRDVSATPPYAYGTGELGAKELIPLFLRADVMFPDANVFSPQGLPLLLLHVLENSLSITPGVLSEIETYLASPDRTAEDGRVKLLWRTVPETSYLRPARYAPYLSLIAHYVRLLSQRKSFPHTVAAGHAEAQGTDLTAKQRKALSDNFAKMSKSTMKMASKGISDSIADEELVVFSFFEAMIFNNSVTAMSYDEDVFAQFFHFRTLLEGDHLAHLVANDIAHNPGSYPPRISIDDVGAASLCRDVEASFAIELPDNYAKLLPPTPEFPEVGMFRPTDPAQFMIAWPSAGLLPVLAKKQAAGGRNTTAFGALNCYTDLPYRSPRGRRCALFLADALWPSDTGDGVGYTVADTIRVLSDIETPRSINLDQAGFATK